MGPTGPSDIKVVQYGRNLFPFGIGDGTIEASLAVTFSPPFTSTPIVVASLFDGNLPSFAKVNGVHMMVTSVGTSSFSYTVSNSSGINPLPANSFGVYWVASLPT